MTGNPRRGIALAVAVAFALAPAAAGTALADTGATNDVYEVNEGGTLVIDAPGVLSNDTNDAGTPCVTGIGAQELMGNLGDNDNTGWRSDGSFTFTPYEWWNGETSFIYGMTKLDEVNTCTGAADDQGIVTIRVLAVNDAPTAVLVLTCLDTIRVRANSGPYDDPQHCTEMHNWGPIDENTQAIDEWVVTTNRPELFSEQPKVTIFDITYGQLHFTPAPDASGVAEVTVRGRDDGGTARGGQDLSNKLTFSIRIAAAPTEPPATEPPATEQPSFDPGMPSTAPTADPPPAPSASADASSPEPTTGEVASDPTGFASGSSGLIAAVLVIGILAIGAGLLAPRLIQRGRQKP
ncbi:MAG TPA: Ig-like domain-containing protein [Candidatus Limnocylindria bacterium]|nr:Ig-like domain-containing protein [Candidatus Limnocylindria bacterium]